MFFPFPNLDGKFSHHNFKIILKTREKKHSKFPILEGILHLSLFCVYETRVQFAKVENFWTSVGYIAVFI